jgi:hypothetical protein
VSLFIERYLLAITAGLTVLIVASNPMKFDWTQRITGALALVFASYFFAHTAQIKNRSAGKAQESAAPSQPPAVPAPRQTGPATTFGDHSPANTGDGNTFRDGVATPKNEGEKK